MDEVPSRHRPARSKRGLSVVGAALLTAAGAVAATIGGAGAAHAAGTTLYASPTGSGSSCTSSAPCSLTGAQSLVRTMNSAMTADITVQMAGGTYRLTQPLALDSRDSGTGGHNVVWAAAAGATPVLSGGTSITGWTQTDPSKNIWTAPAPAGLATRQLYVNGVRDQRASGPVPVTLTKTDTGYTASSTAMATWRNPSDLEFVYTGGDNYWSHTSSSIGYWTEIRCPVGSISGTAITMAQPCWDNTDKRATLPNVTPTRSASLVTGYSLGQPPAYVENAYELLDQPGEWYLDSSADKISYIPRAGENLSTADVEAPALQTLVSGAGTAASPVSNIVFSGIQFAYATWMAPSSGDGFSEIQANYRITGTGGGATQGLCTLVPGGACPYGAWTKEPGNVEFSYAHNVQFLRDAFVHLGAAGLDLGDGSQGSTVQGCVFTDISGNGLELGGVDIPQPTSSADHTSGNKILNNHLYALPVEYHGGVGIDVGYAEGTTISHNQIDHTAYSGISIGWGGWPDKISQAPQANYSNHNVLSDNLITYTLQRHEDGGAIYTNGITGTSMTDGEQEIGNVAYGSVNTDKEFYTDNGATFVTLTGNVTAGNYWDFAGPHQDYAPGAPAGSWDPTIARADFWPEGNAFTSTITSQANRVIATTSEAPPSTLGNAGIQSAYQDILNLTSGAASVPDAPADPAAFAANGSAYVGFNPTFVEHGAPVTSYTVTANPGGAHTTITAAQYQSKNYAVVTGLTNGTPYTFTVTATNANGTSNPSMASTAVTPVAGSGALPGAPTSVKTMADATDGRVTVTWVPPATTGDTPIIGYTVSAPGVPSVTVTGRNAFDRPSNISATIENLKPGTAYTFTVKANNAVGAGAGASAAAVTLTTPTLSGTYSNPGTSNDSATTAANFDGNGYSLSAQALSAAGVTPGGSVTAGGQTFTWPNATAGAIDNTVASGQTVTVAGTGTTLGFLATSTAGAATGTGTITYTDGTTQTYTLATGDWYATPPAGSTVAITMSHRNTPTGPGTSHSTYVYYVGIALQSGKAVATVTLPNISAIPETGVPTLHVFATTIS